MAAFAQTLRRYTSLNHLAQAARAVLQNPTQISQMLADLNRVDFTFVQVCRAFSSRRHPCFTERNSTNPSLFTTFCLKSWDKFFESKRSFYFTGAGFVGLRLRRHDGSPTGTGFQVDFTGSELARAVGSLAGECGQPSSRALRERPWLRAASATIYTEVVFLQVSENIRYIFSNLPYLPDVWRVCSLLVRSWFVIWRCAAPQVSAPFTSFVCSTTNTCSTWSSRRLLLPTKSRQWLWSAR